MLFYLSHHLYFDNCVINLNHITNWLICSLKFYFNDAKEKVLNEITYNILYFLYESNVEFKLHPKFQKVNLSKYHFQHVTLLLPHESLIVDVDHVYNPIQSRYFH